jgi:hypothetical protein
MTWKDFIRTHLDVLAGTDFFSVEVLTRRGLETYYVRFFLHLGSRRVSIAGIPQHPDEGWMQQMARNATLEQWGILNPCATCCMIATRNSAPRSETRWQQWV